jgi:malate synthase
MRIEDGSLSSASKSISSPTSESDSEENVKRRHKLDTKLFQDFKMEIKKDLAKRDKEMDEIRSEQAAGS